MKKLLSLIIIPLLLAAALYIPGYAKVTGTTKDVEIEIIAPEKIVNPGEFTVYARIINCKSTGKVKLKNAAWKVNDKEFKQDIDYELSPSDKSKERLEELRSKTELTPQDKEEIKECQDKLNSATCLLSFNITEDMAKQIKNKGASDISLSIQGIDMNTTGVIKAAKGTVVTSGTLQRLVYVPEGFNINNFKFGDTHTHSTQSREFLGLTGTGIYSISQLKYQAKIAGLQWITLTDHAYCLNSTTFDSQKSTVTGLCDSSFAFLYGEELSVDEDAGDTGHMNGIMNSTFVPCVTDFFRNASSPTASQGIASIEGYGGLVTINHPGETTSFLGFADANYGVIENETGIEILNGDLSTAKNTTSANSWINKLLLTGQRAFPFAGSDTEDTNNLGKCFDVVYSSTLSQSAIKDSLAGGHYYVSTGPALAIWAKNSSDTSWGQMGNEIPSGTNVDIYLSYAYSNDMAIYVVKENLNTKTEVVINSFTTNRRNRTNYKTINASVEPGCYIRAYCVDTTNPGRVAYTTPIWFK